MSDSWTLFAVLFGGFVLLFASILGFVATVEHDRHCQLTEVRDTPQGDSIEYYYSELNGEEQQLFHQLRQDRGKTVHGDACVDGVVRSQDQYYIIKSWKTIQWTNPLTILSTGGIFGAGGIIVYVGQREVESAPW